MTNANVTTALMPAEFANFRADWVRHMATIVLLTLDNPGRTDWDPFTNPSTTETTTVVAPVQPAAEASAVSTPTVALGTPTIERLFEVDPNIAGELATAAVPKQREDEDRTPRNGTPLMLIDPIATPAAEASTTKHEDSAATDEQGSETAEPVVATASVHEVSPTIQPESPLPVAVVAGTPLTDKVAKPEADDTTLSDEDFLQRYMEDHSTSVQGAIAEHTAQVDAIGSSIGETADRIAAKTQATLAEAKERARRLHEDYMQEEGRRQNERYIRRIALPELKIKTAEELGTAGIRQVVAQVVALAQEASSLSAEEVGKILNRTFTRLTAPDTNNTSAAPLVSSSIQSLRRKGEFDFDSVVVLPSLRPELGPGTSQES